MKLEIYNFVVDITTHENPSGVAATWVVWVNTWHVTCFDFLFNLLSYLLYFWDHTTPTSVDHGWILTI